MLSFTFSAKSRAVIMDVVAVVVAVVLLVVGFNVWGVRQWEKKGKKAEAVIKIMHIHLKYVGRNSSASCRSRSTGKVFINRSFGRPTAASRAINLTLSVPLSQPVEQKIMQSVASAHSAFKNIVNNMHYTPSPQPNSCELLLLVVNGRVLCWPSLHGSG